MKEWIQKHKAELIYLVLGAMTTAVNYLVFLPCYYAFELSAAVSNAVAWVVAVIFAFLTNKPFAFESHDWALKTVWSEFLRFVACRVGSGVLETGVLWVCVDILAFPGSWMKVLTSILVIILNYFGSKMLVFRK